MPRSGPVFRLLAAVGVAAWTAGCGEPTPPPAPNQFPYVTIDIPPMTRFLGDTVIDDLSDNFRDPDGDELTFAATSSAPAVVDASVAGAILRLVPRAKDTADVRITATDDENASVEINVRVTVGNRAPALIDTIPPWERHVGELEAFVLSDHFVDPDGDPVTYEATSTNHAVVLATLSGDTIRMEAVGRGEASVSVRATDSDSASTNMHVPATIVPIPERKILEYLYRATGGADWVMSDNWLTDADLAAWHGVGLNEHGEIRSLSLGANNLSGTIPPVLGELFALERLGLGSNDLGGPLPASFAKLWLLSELDITDNPRLEGEIQAEFRRELDQLEVLLAGGTDVCAPNEREFREWLADISERRVKMCRRVPPAAHLIQSAQSHQDSTPGVALVGGKGALLRVFVTSSHSTHDVRIPPVKATFHLGDEETHAVTIPGKSGNVPIVRTAGSLEITANVRIPSEVIEPGLEMVIEIDPDGTLDEELGVQARIPESGRTEVEVEEMPAFELTVIPFLWEDDPDSAILGYTKRMGEEEEDYALLFATYDLLPTGDFDVAAYEAVETSTNNAFSLLQETDVIRLREDDGRYYQGQMSGRVGGAAGVAWLSHKSSFSIPDNRVIAHELGHNQSLLHAPCGGAGGPDPDYPYDGARIGIWGYDMRHDSLKSPATFHDIMSYCQPAWISDYFFSQALRYRTTLERRRQSGASASVRTILLWGGLDESGRPYLKPSFIMEAAPSVPASSGAYGLVGRDAGGTELFSLGFDMPRVEDAPGKTASFVFTLPVQDGWAGSLASLRLSGSGGSVTLTEHSDVAMTIAYDGLSGRIRAFWDGWREHPADRPELVLLRSRGVPGPVGWER